VARSSASQPFVKYTHLMWEVYYTTVKQMFLRSAKEGGKMMWAHLGLSIIPDVQYKGLRVFNLSGLVDNTHNITCEHPECRNAESTFDVIEDPADKKCNVKLIYHLANTCPNEQVWMFCYEGGYQVMMIAQHTPNIKVDPKRNIGHNTVKFVNNLMTLIGVPNLRKGRVGNNGIRRDGIGNLVKHKVGESVQKTTARRESVDMQGVHTHIKQEVINGNNSVQMLNNEAVDRIMDRVNPGRIKSRLDE
jgi:hypothetical protein